MVDKGAVFGRFQVFHLKQMEYVLAAKMRCSKLYIGITHSDLVAYAPVSELDRNTMTKRDNPLTYLERFEMIQGALLDFGISREEFEIVPFPISCPELIFQYTPEDAVYYMNISTDWDDEKCRMLTKIGARVEVLRKRDVQDRGITGREIRTLIAEGKDWKQHVPKTVAEYIVNHGLDERIRGNYNRIQTSAETEKEED